MRIIRETTMLKFEEVKQDLGISNTALYALIENGLLHPTLLGKGYKFSQKDLLEFQEKFKGADLSNTSKILDVVEKMKEL